MRVLLAARALSSLELIVIWILYISAFRHVKSKCQKVKTPRMIGDFQRNIVTFRQTVIYFTIQSLFIMIQKISPSIISNQVEVQNTLGYMRTTWSKMWKCQIRRSGIKHEDIRDGQDTS